MRFFIRQIILWPKDPSKMARRLKFRPGKINVITGRSRTGKSAITAIIDYCLGAGKCAIPVGRPIREKTDWFSVIVQTADDVLRISRANPGDASTSTEYELQHGKRAFTKQPPIASTTVDAFKAHMNRVARLSPIGMEPKAEDSRGVGRASFRDMAAFNFLPQHIVANPYTLFFKADTIDHREKLRSILPLALGAIDNDYLLNRQRLTDIEREGKQVASQIDQRKAAIDAWKSETLGLHQRAKELGLLSTASRPSDVESIAADLSSIPASISDRISAIQTGLTAEAVQRLEDIRKLEQALNSNLADYRRRLRGARKLQGSVESFGDAIQRHGKRLHGSGWFGKQITGHGECPVCGTDTGAAIETLASLQEPIEEVERLTAAAGNAPEALDREIAELENATRKTEGRLFEVRRERLELEMPNDTDGAGQTLEEVYRFVGRLEQALRNIEIVQGDDGLETRRQKLREEYKEVKKNLNEKRRRAIEEAAHKSVSDLIGRYSEELYAQGGNLNPEIDPRELNIRFTRIDEKRKDFLWEIGSGANWMAYHLAALLALQEFFIKSLAQSPVPSFLLIDQPSQVFFPGETYERAITNRGTDTLPDNDDFRQTRRIFEVLSLAIRRMDGQLQIIVTEHADHLTWDGVENIHPVANWHSDNADYLIPRAWL